MAKSSIKEVAAISSYPLGAELQKAFSGEFSFIKALFAIPEMPKRIMDMAQHIKDCNLNNKGNENALCVIALKKERDEIAKDVVENGLVFEWDIFDNFWDKLPGD